MRKAAAGETPDLTVPKKVCIHLDRLLILSKEKNFEKYTSKCVLKLLLWWLRS